MIEKPQRIGLYGGGFDPIHIGHIVLAQTAIEKLKLDRVIFMPSGGQAHYKDESNIASGADRVAMARLAAGSDPRMEVSSYEAEQAHFIYTIDTLRYIQTSYPEGTEIFLLVGGDWKNNMSAWKDGDILIREFKVVVFSRPGFDDTPQESPDTSDDLIRYESMPPTDLSSTTIRNRIRQALPIDGMVPDSVRDYITEHGLYR